MHHHRFTGIARRAFISAFFAITAASTAARAEAPAETILVTAFRVPVPLAATGSSVTVIDREQIERSPSVFAGDLLRQVPGLTVSSSGSAGAQSQVRIRGAEANHVLVLIDGVEANDAAGNDDFRFQDLTTWDIGRIEIVRGPQSALWGSDALAGVVNIVTREPDEAFTLEAFGERGAFDTLAGGARAGGTLLGTRIGLGVSHLDTDGENIARTGSEDDGYDNTTLNLRLAATPMENLELKLSARHTEADKAFDETDVLITGLPTDTADRAEVSLGQVAGSGTLSLLDGRWDQSVRATWATTDTDNFNEFGDNGSTASERFGISYETTWHFVPPTTRSAGTAFTLALDHEDQDFSQRGLATPFGDPNQDQKLRNTALVAQLIASPWTGTTFSVSGRHDHNSDFEDIETFRATATWAPADGPVRLRSSAGTGQKAPTFIERFGFFADQFIGNPELKPEKSTGWEVGGDVAFSDGRASAGVTYFHEDLEDEIDGFVFDPGAGAFTAENLEGDSRRRGIEVMAHAEPAEELRLLASYTYTDATSPDPVSGALTREIRRPRHAGNLTGDWSPTDRAGINLTLSYTGSRTDNFFQVAPPFATEVVDLPDYWLAAIAARYRINEALLVYVRGENLLNEDYEDVYGFNTPGIGVHVGLRLTFGRR